MKITNIRFGMLRVPLKTPFKTALRTVETVEDIVVVVETDDGRVGYGEAPATAVIFRGVPLAGKKLASPDGPEVRGVIGLLTQRALLRNPYRNEVERYVRLATDIESTGHAEPARAFMQAVCFAILTSTESVFY